MTAPVALLVTGSRSLAKQTDEEARRNITPASEKWARAILAEVIGALPPKSLLIHGGATGPDSWAQEAIEARRDDPGLVYAVTYEANGRRWVWTIGDGDLWWSDDRWHPADIGPLVRNRHMVEAALPEQVIFGREPASSPWWTVAAARRAPTTPSAWRARRATRWTVACGR